MFTQELSIGAKRAILEYVTKRGIPTAEIYSEEEAKRLDSRANLVVRADGSCQWNGFSGVFGSYSTQETLLKISGPRPGEAYTPNHLTLEQLMAIASLDENFNSGDEHRDGLVKYNIKRIQERIGWYCRGLGLDIPDKPKVLIQDAHSKSDALFQHPNNQKLVVISRNKRTALYNRVEESFTYFVRPYEHENGFEIPPDDREYLKAAIKTYDKIFTFEKFADMGMTFEMEFGKHIEDGIPVVYQFKPFRKIEKANYSLVSESGKRVVNFDLPIGVLSPEGKQLTIKKFYSGNQYSNSVSLMIPSGDRDFEYPHVSMPGIQAILYPVFDYTRDHGARESLMKVPSVFCNVSEFNGTTSIQCDGIRVSNYTALQKLKDLMQNGQTVRLYSDGVRGRMIIE